MYQAYSLVADRAEEPEHVVRDRGVEAGETADALQGDGDEHQRESRQEDPLQDVGDGRGQETAHHRVDRDDDGIDEVDRDGIRVGDERLQLALLLPLAELGQAGRCGRFEAGLVRLGLEGPVFVEEVDALLLLDRVLRGRLRRQGHHGLGRDHVAGPVAEEGHEQGEDGERAAEEPALEALGEEIADGHQPDAAEEGRGEPVERRQEEDEVLDPHAADALAVDLAGDDDGLVGVGRRPQVEEELVDLAQAAAGDEEIVGRLRSARRPPAEPEDEHDEDADDREIEDMQAKYGH